ncbi:MAG: thymidine phosphorylase, partial [Candidatus Krumholzibacteria bacterium]|nr:thymidine phosphorylase [Candidatus Krumholzibacteria bacterium]
FSCVISSGTANVSFNIYNLICRKRDGSSLGGDEIRFLVGGFLDGEISDRQMAAFLMAVAIRGMTLEETVHFTREMMESGMVFHFEDLPGPVVDKHSTGGVGDKVSLILVPLAVECGLYVPMISGRALGFTGGTLDKLESIPGMRTDLSPERFERQVRELGACFSAQTGEIVPADRKIYELRDETATVKSVPLIVSSILSKKLAEGISGVVIDVKCGGGAFMREPQDAAELASSLESVGQEMGVRVKTVVSAMDEPLGMAVGNALEVNEAIDVLQGNGPPDCVELTHRLVAEMLVLGGIVKGIDEGRARSCEVLESGRALERFMKVICAQGGRLDLGSGGYGLPKAPVKSYLQAASDGYVSGIDSRIVGETVSGMGGGRTRAGQEIDPCVGVVFLKRKGERVKAGEAICEIHSSSESGAEKAAHRLVDTVVISEEPPRPSPLFPV